MKCWHALPPHEHDPSRNGCPAEPLDAFWKWRTEMTENPCPVCGEPVPEESIWIEGNRFLCSEMCARKANDRRYGRG